MLVLSLGLALSLAGSGAPGRLFPLCGPISSSGRQLSLPRERKVGGGSPVPRRNGSLGLLGSMGQEGALAMAFQQMENSRSTVRQAGVASVGLLEAAILGSTEGDLSAGARTCNLRLWAFLGAQVCPIWGVED